MRALVIAVVLGVSVAARSQTPLPAEYCPAGAKPPSCGFLPSDAQVRWAEVGASKLRYVAFALYMKCISKAVIERRQDQAAFDRCTIDAMARAINRFNALESTPSCQNFSQIALNLLSLSKIMAGRVYCNGTVPLNFGVPGRVPADTAVARVERGASKLLVREYQKMVRCYGDGVEALARGRTGTIARCVARLRAIQERRMMRFDFGLPGFGRLGCFDEAAGTGIRQLLAQIDAAANLNAQIFCSM
jgi:hypothetical protein